MLYSSGFSGHVCAALTDLGNGNTTEWKTIVPLGKGIGISESVSGVSSFQNDSADISLVNDALSYSISLTWTARSGEDDLSVEMTFPAGKDSGSYISVIPLGDKMYNCDSVCHFNSVSGFISSSGFKRTFNSTAVFASYETVRGILPRMVGKATVESMGKNRKNGISLRFSEYAEGDSGFSAVMKKGVVIPVKDLSIYENDHLIAGTGDGSAIVFTPTAEYRTENSLLFSRTCMNRSFGIFAGSVVIDKKKMRLDGFTGWIEKYSINW
jgi:hypothetical protein